MRYMYEDAEMELLELFQAIHKDPASWSNWLCMHISLDSQKAVMHRNQIQLDASHIIERYIKGENGKVLFLGDDDIYILCKDIPIHILESLGQQLTTYLQSKAQVHSKFIIMEPSKDPSSISLQTNKANPFTPANDKSPIKRTTPIKKILIVEDDLITRKLIYTALKDNYDVLTAGSAQQGLAEYYKHEPDAVFLDINLPDQTGLDLLVEMLSYDETTSVVMCSSDDNISNMVKSLTAGASGFIAKPFTRGKLLSYITQVV